MAKTDHELIRVEQNIYGTFGTYKIDGMAFCVTLEETQKAVTYDSRIPAGVFYCKRVYSPLVERITKGRWKETFEITGIPGRKYIRIHPGNTKDDTLGCVLIGENYDKLRGISREIRNSGKTFDKFMLMMHDVNEFKISIKEAA